jgi:hypothetical protein
MKVFIVKRKIINLYIALSYPFYLQQQAPLLFFLLSLVIVLFFTFLEAIVVNILKEGIRKIIFNDLLSYVSIL